MFFFVRRRGRRASRSSFSSTSTSTPTPPQLPPKQKTSPQRIHFRKEDERLLRKLLAKVKAQADTVRRRGFDFLISFLWMLFSRVRVFFSIFSLLLFSLERPHSSLSNQKISTDRRPRGRRSSGLGDLGGQGEFFVFFCFFHFLREGERKREKLTFLSLFLSRFSLP